MALPRSTIAIKGTPTRFDASQSTLYNCCSNETVILAVRVSLFFPANPLFWRQLSLLWFIQVQSKNVVLTKACGREERFFSPESAKIPEIFPF